MKTQVKQWGNSVAVRIPKPFAEEIGIVDGTNIEISLVNKKIIVSKAKSKLSDLLEKITPENIHGETSTGFIKGKEVW